MTTGALSVQPTRPARRAWGRWLAAALLAGVTAAAVAEALSDADAAAARATVESQLDAMADGDDARAFSFASQEIRRQFGDAQRFMAMVRRGYPMVIAPSTRHFLRAERADDGAVFLRVRLSDRASRRWLATYGLRREGSVWRIDGCVVAHDTGGPST